MRRAFQNWPRILAVSVIQLVVGVTLVACDKKVSTPPEPIVNEPSPFDREMEGSQIPSIPNPWRGARDVAAGEEFICALDRERQVTCWGGERFGELGDGPPYESEKLRLQRSNRGVFGALQIAANRGSACALVQDGTVSCWGNNYYGQVGDGTSENRAAPRTVSGLSDAIDLDVGGRHACAVVRGNALLCWGDNEDNQLSGNTRSRVRSATPVETPGSGVVSVALGNLSTCTLDRTGAVYCVGSNRFGELGRGEDGDELPNSAGFARVNNLPPVLQLSGFGNHYCALTESRDVYCWGGQRPVPARELRHRQRRIDANLPVDPLPQIGTPTKVPGLENVQEITVGMDFSCARGSAGELYCWGKNEYGQLGSGSQSDRETPSPVAGLRGATSVVAGGRNTCAILSDRRLMCWGENRHGQLGNGGRSTALVPTAVLEPE